MMKTNVFLRHRGDSLQCFHKRLSAIAALEAIATDFGNYFLLQASGSCSIFRLSP
jgi:hypothetical protein